MQGLSTAGDGSRSIIPSSDGLQGSHTLMSARPPSYFFRAKKISLGAIALLAAYSRLHALAVVPSNLGNVFSAGETLTIPVTIDPGSTLLSWTVIDYFGRQVSTGSTGLGGSTILLHPSTNGEVGYFGLNLTEAKG